MSTTVERITRNPQDVVALLIWVRDMAIDNVDPLDVEQCIDPEGEPLSLCLARLLGGVQWAAENHERLGVNGIVWHRMGQLISEANDLSHALLKTTEEIPLLTAQVRMLTVTEALASLFKYRIAKPKQLG